MPWGGRPKKYATEAERKAAKLARRIQLRDGRKAGTIPPPTRLKPPLADEARRFQQAKRSHHKKVADDDDAADETFAAPPKKVRAGGCSEFGEVGLAIIREQERITQAAIQRQKEARLSRSANKQKADADA